MELYKAFGPIVLILETIKVSRDDLMALDTLLITKYFPCLLPCPQNLVPA